MTSRHNVFNVGNSLNLEARYLMDDLYLGTKVVASLLLNGTASSGTAANGFGPDVKFDSFFN